MRFNVVIGGQLISKSARGFLDFNWDFFGKVGVLVAAILLTAPFITYYVISRFIPVFEHDKPGSEPGSRNQQVGQEH